MSRVDAQNTVYNLIISMVDSWMCPFRPCACPPPWKEYPFKGWFVCVFILTLASNYFIYFSHGDDHREPSKTTKLSLTNLQKWLWTPRTHKKQSIVSCRSSKVTAIPDPARNTTCEMTKHYPLSHANLPKWLCSARNPTCETTKHSPACKSSKVTAIQR